MGKKGCYVMVVMFSWSMAYLILITRWLPEFSPFPTLFPKALHAMKIFRLVQIQIICRQKNKNDSKI